MRKKNFYLGLIIIVFLSGFSFVTTAEAQNKTVKRAQTILLGETLVKINVYEQAGAGVTFFAPHRNEQIALELAKAAIEEHGGRLVEIKSFDETVNPSRRLNFKAEGKFYTLDPNRIFTQNGRNCSGFPAEIQPFDSVFGRRPGRVAASFDARVRRQ